MKVGALDLGTNSFLCLIAEVEEGAISRVYDDQVEIVRLGQDVNRTKMFHPEALARAKRCLENFSELIKKQRPAHILAMATSAARDVTNKQELFKICHDLKIPLEIIPGEKEAEITYRGAVSASAGEENILVLDIGGGSTEIILGKGKRLIGGLSLNIGAVRLTEKFFSQQPPTVQDIAICENFIEEQVRYALKEIQLLANDFQVDKILAVAGTPTELVRAEIGIFDVQKIDGFVLDQKKLDQWIDKFSKTSSEERIEKLGIQPGRADVILAGTMILRAVSKVFKKDLIKVSTRGVRYGVALELAERFS